jgi:hypothetical protein
MVARGPKPKIQVREKMEVEMESITNGQKQAEKEVC